MNVAIKAIPADPRDRIKGGGAKDAVREVRDHVQGNLFVLLTDVKSFYVSRRCRQWVKMRNPLGQTDTSGLPPQTGHRSAYSVALSMMVGWHSAQPLGLP